jgi:hypothetical protein
MEFEFCPECDNKLYPTEIDKELYNKCDCGFKELYDNNKIINKKNYKNKGSISINNNKYVIFDPAIPRTIHKVCPNKSCISVSNPELQEAVFKQDPITIRLEYICVHCRTEWKY